MDNVEVEDCEFSSVVDTLVNMFGNILNKDVITAVVENCAGDLNLSAEAIMNITDGHNTDNTDVAAVLPKQPPTEEVNLITFTNTDENIMPKDDTHLDASENNAFTVEAEVTSTPSKPPQIKSNLNVDATVYVPRSSYITDEMMPTEATASSSINTNNVQYEYLPTLIPSVTSTEADTNPPITTDTFQSLISYSNVTRKTGAVPKKPMKSTKHESETKLSPQIRGVVDYHIKGFRILILMRGVPGSGKSYLSRQVIQATIGDNLEYYKTHILSTDDFFHSKGGYEFNKVYLQEAHAWNQQRAKSAMERGLSPIIIDNTNIEAWEMEPYVRAAVSNGYKIETMEPKTPWAKKPTQLQKKNIHGVKLHSIIRMLENYSENITGDYLINYYKLSYPNHMVPPVLRKIPPVVSDDRHFIPKGIRMVNKTRQKSPVHEQQNNTNDVIYSQSSIVIPMEEAKDDVCNDSKVLSAGTTKSDERVIPSHGEVVTDLPPVSENTATEIEPNELNKNKDMKQDCYIEIEQQLAELEKIEIAWENNEGWDERVETTNNESNSMAANEPKPQRENVPTRSCCDEKLINDINYCNDWAQISMFMPPWTNETPEKKEVALPAEMTSSSTCFEFGDTDIYNNTQIFKVISATARDINEHYISPHREKIPEKRMLDKSSMTNERFITENFRCKNEERHFTAFRKMFKTIPKSDLRDIFNQCSGDVNWAVEIVLDGLSNNQLTFMETLDLSDAEEESAEQCTCLAAYNIVPDMGIHENTDTQDAENCIDNNIPDTPTDNVMQSQRKPKKEMSVSDISIQLKRQIEQNVVISDNHYSMHCLKIRKLRRGESNVKITEVGSVNTEDTENAQALDPFKQTNVQDKDSSNVESSDDESNVSVDDLEKVVNVRVGKEFIQSLDDLFGRRGITYPDNVVPRLSIPISLANELNALWMESLMHQLDEYEKQSAAMVKQDEEFARQLTLKEIELAQAGKEPEVPDFKEIMDMDFAMSVYQKDVAEWRNKEPNNLAARMTRDKLFNLFPEVPQDTLSELLVAHDNNFKATVEVLLMSTGKSEVLEQKNGLVKFVMTKEFKRQEEIMQEQKKALSDVEWPLLPRGESADMSVVTKYRDAAAQHLVRRNMCHKNAQDYFRRGMTTVATYYTGVASFHKNMFDKANSLAAASLMQIHAQRAPDNATIDLHYLRVAEAKESMDLFLDSHISKLRELRSQNRGPGQRTLFFITGRGVHSQGGPRVKPAVKKRLRERGLACHERNPGLLCARITADDKLSYQVQT